MKVETYQCDVCGKTKQDANHWWRLVFNADRKLAVVQPLLAHYFPEWRGPVNPMQDARSLEPLVEVAHLCGQDCVTKKLSEVMK